MQDYFMLTTNSESLGDDSFDMMIATQDALQTTWFGFKICQDVTTRSKRVLAKPVNENPMQSPRVPPTALIVATKS